MNNVLETLVTCMICKVEFDDRVEGYAELLPVENQFEAMCGACCATPKQDDIKELKVLLAEEPFVDDMDLPF